MAELPEGLGAFDADDLRFVVDDGYSLVALDDAIDVDQQALAEHVSASGRVPARAPIASWILARLAHLAGGSLAIEEEIVEVCEGGLYVIDFVIRQRGAAIGKVQLQAGQGGAALLGMVSRRVSPEEVVARFISALLEAPDEVAACHVRVRDPAWPEDRVAEYGFDGETFRG